MGFYQSRQLHCVSAGKCTAYERTLLLTWLVLWQCICVSSLSLLFSFFTLAHIWLEHASWLWLLGMFVAPAVWHLMAKCLWTLICSFQNLIQIYSPLRCYTSSSTVGRVFTRFWSVAVEICVRSTIKALVRSSPDGGQWVAWGAVGVPGYSKGVKWGLRSGLCAVFPQIWQTMSSWIVFLEHSWAPCFQWRDIRILIVWFQVCGKRGNGMKGIDLVNMHCKNLKRKVLNSLSWPKLVSV